MKRLLALTLFLIMCLCACGKSHTALMKTGSTPVSDGVLVPAPTVKQLSNLFNENLYCMNRLLTLGSLPTGSTPIQGDHVYPVESDRFQTYAQLKEYLHTVYTAEATELLLDNNGMPVYLDVDGKLCVDTYHVGGKGYFVDWTGYKLTIADVQGSTCHFTVSGTLTDPADEPTPEPYTANGTAVYEDGRWVLTGMVS